MDSRSTILEQIYANNLCIFCLLKELHDTHKLELNFRPLITGASRVNKKKTRVGRVVRDFPLR